MAGGPPNPKGNNVKTPTKTAPAPAPVQQLPAAPQGAPGQYLDMTTGQWYNTTPSANMQLSTGSPSTTVAPNSSGQFTYKRANDLTAIGNTDPAMGGQTNTPDLLAQLQQLYTQQAPNFAGDANGTAAGIYAPILQDLTKQGQLAQDHAKFNDAQLAAMYSALGRDIGNSAGSIRSNTSNLQGNIANNASVANNAIGANYGEAQNNVAGLMQQLGIQAAAPDVLPRQAEHQGMLQGITSANAQAAQNLAAQLGNDALNFNTAQQNIAGFEGNENRRANQQDLSNKLAQLASSRAQIGSQQANTASDLLMRLQDQYLNSLNAKASALTNAYSAEQQAAINKNNFALQLMQMQKSMMPTAYQQYQMTPMSDKLSAYAGQLFGTNGNAASSALNLIQSLGSQGAPNALAFADSVKKAAANSSDPILRTLPANQLAALAMQAYSQAGVNPNYMNYAAYNNNNG